MSFGSRTFIAYEAAIRSASEAPFELAQYQGDSVEVFVDVTNAAGGAITVVIEVENPATHAYIPLLTSAALSAVATTRLEVGPGITPSANLALATRLSRKSRIRVIHNNGNPLTYSIGGTLFSS